MFLPVSHTCIYRITAGSSGTSMQRLCNLSRFPLISRRTCLEAGYSLRQVVYGSVVVPEMSMVDCQKGETSLSALQGEVPGLSPPSGATPPRSWTAIAQEHGHPDRMRWDRCNTMTFACRRLQYSPNPLSPTFPFTLQPIETSRAVSIRQT